jgi:hypothetical protein
MKRNLLVTAAVWCASLGAHAASYIVWPGQSLQTAINNAMAGDNITVMAGSYNQNITISKGIDIRGEAGKTIQVTGTLTISNAPAAVYIKGIDWGQNVANGSGITVTSSSDVRIDDCRVLYNTLAGANLSVTGSKFYLFKTSITGSATFTNSDWTLQGSAVGSGLTSNTSNTKIIKSTITGACVHNDATKELTVFQSTLTENLNINALKYWVCYNTIRYMAITGGTGEVTGNSILGRGGRLNGVTLTNSNVVIRNNYIADFREDAGGSVLESDNGIVVVSGTAKVTNNLIRNLGNASVNYGKTAVGISIYVKGTVSTEITGNIIQDCVNGCAAGVGGPYSVFAPQAGVIATYNNLRNGYAGGVVPANCINTDPLFVNPAIGNYTLRADSPCRDTGPTDPQYNDLDGSRNDMGMYGGHSYDPNGKTTTAPVVLSSEVSPLFIKRGGTVTIKARAGVAAE